MISVVVDIDDTLVNTSRRMQAVWRLVLGFEVPLEAVETLSLEQVFMKFASPEQKQRGSEFQKRFWDVALCLDEVGFESVGLNHHCPRCGTSYCFSCACRASWKCPKCGSELV